MTSRSMLRATALTCAGLLLATLTMPPASVRAAGATAATATSGGEVPEKLALESAKRLLAPVALYPDPILSAVLEAATTPLDVVEAERFLARREADPTRAPDPDWSPAILALLNHPELLRRMSEDLDRTHLLGAAVVEDLQVVQRAIQEIRKGALALGLLADTEFQRIVREDDLVAIEPVDPEAVRVPVYDADQLLAALAAAPASAASAEPPTPRPKPEPPTAAPVPAAITAAPAPAPAWVPPAAVEPYPAPAAPAPSLSYAEPERGFWSDAAIFAGGAALGGVLGYLLADRDDDEKVVKKYYYFGERRPPGWSQHHIHWRDEGWRPRARIIRADKIVIKDSNVVVTGNDILVRRLAERRHEFLRVARPDGSAPERWFDRERAKRHERDGGLVLLREARPEPAREPARIAVLPDRRSERDRRSESRPTVGALPDARERVRVGGEEKKAAERATREERRRRKALELDRQRAQAEARAQEERHRAAEQRRLERARAAEIARAREIEGRRAEEQAKLRRQHQRGAKRLERPERRERDAGERADRRGGGRDQEGRKRRLWQEG